MNDYNRHIVIISKNDYAWLNLYLFLLIIAYDISRYSSNMLKYPLIIKSLLPNLARIRYKMNKKHVYIIHGYLATPQDHWFPWLRQKLNDDGMEASILPMPDSLNPDVTTWIQYLKEKIGQPNENIFFVAHSLGCITLLHYLNTLNENKKIGGIVLVSGFMDSLSIFPELDEFIKIKFDHDHILSLTNNLSIIAAKDDIIVPHKQTEELSNLLKTKLLSINNGGHFLASDGFTELPLVYEELSKMLN